jgi:hypothetical protein
MKRYGAAFYGIVGSVEEFWEMDAAMYRRIHPPGGAAKWRFRSVRARSFTDPLAYLVGLRARRALREFSRTA